MIDSILLVIQYIAIIFAISLALNILYDIGFLIVNSEWEQLLKVMKAVYTTISLLLQGLINISPVIILIFIVLIFGPVPLIIIAIARLFGARMALFVIGIVILIYSFMWIT